FRPAAFFFSRSSNLFNRSSFCVAVCIPRPPGGIRELAKNGRGIKRSVKRAYEFLCCLAARIRALCAIELVAAGTKIRRKRALCAITGQRTGRLRFSAL